jgi:hypothetical protein
MFARSFFSKTPSSDLLSTVTQFIQFLQESSNFPHSSLYLSQLRVIDSWVKKIVSTIPGPLSAVNFSTNNVIDKKLRKELQDVTQRILESCIALSSVAHSMLPTIPFLQLSQVCVCARCRSRTHIIQITHYNISHLFVPLNQYYNI